MTEPTPRIDGIRQQQCSVDDADETTLIAAVATDLSHAKLWAVTRAGAARYIGRTEGTGKIDSAWPRYFRDGTVRLGVAAADVGGGGATSHTVWFDFPNEVKPLMPACVDQAARNQANAATNMAHAALDQNVVQDAQIAALREGT